jgi:hypothetical protein
MKQFASGLWILLLLAYPVFGQTPNLQWSALYGGSGQNTTYSVAPGIQGKVFVSGTYSGTMALGTQVLQNSGGTDGFVARFSADGNAEWAKRLSGSGDDLIRDVFQDGQGNIFLAGQYGSGCSYEGISMPSEGESDGFIARLNPEGELIWLKTTTNTGKMQWNRVATDSAGNLIALGQFSDTLVLGNNTLTSNSFFNMVLAKFNPAGEVIWAKSWGSSLDDNGFDLWISPSGNIVVSADYQGIITLGSQTLTRKGLSDALVFQTDPDGNPIWAQSIGSRKTDNGFVVTGDANGDVYAAGTFMDTVQVGAVSLISKGAWDIYVFRFGPDGSPLWGNSLGSKNNDRCNGIDLGPDGRVYLHGWFQDTLTAGSFSFTAKGMFDCFVTQMEPGGEISGAFSYGSTNQDVGSDMFVNEQGNLVLAGNFFGSNLSFGSQTLTSTTPTTHFLLRTGPLVSEIESLKNGGLLPIRIRQEGDGRMEVFSSESGMLEIVDGLGRIIIRTELFPNQQTPVFLRRGLYRYRFFSGKKYHSAAFIAN